MHAGALPAEQMRHIVRIIWRSIAALMICAALSGCATWHSNQTTRVDLPERFTVSLDQLVVHSNFELPTQHRLLQEINSERVDISNELNLPISDEKIHVYLFKESAAVLRIHPAKVSKLSGPEGFFSGNRYPFDRLRLLGRSGGRRLAP